MKILIIVLVYFNSVFINYSEISNDSAINVFQIDELYEHPKFKKWIEFWKLKLPELKDFVLEGTDTITNIFFCKIDLRKWFKERKLREFTLDYSPENNYVTDIYSHVGFEYSNDSIFAMGGDVDPSFQIINIKDSISYCFTFGPYSFFDESIWLSDSTCYILGFTFDDSRKNVSLAYCKILILQWDFNKNVVTVSRSNKLSFKNDLMSFQIYMYYLYPEFKGN